MNGEAYKFKVVLIGDPNVGKTSMILRYVINRFDENYLITIGTRVYKKEVMAAYRNNKEMVHLLIWDTTGQKEFIRTLKTSLRGTQGAFVVCDITRLETLEHVEEWVRHIVEIAGEIPMVLIANKSDLKGKYAFSKEDFLSVAKKFGASAMITSAKNGSNINQAFQTISEKLLWQYHDEGSNMKLGENAEDPNISTIHSTVDYEDYLIAQFCEYYGDQEIAMSIIRKQIKDTRTSFTTPKMEDLVVLSGRLRDILNEVKGENRAKEFYFTASRAVNRLEANMHR